MLGTYLPLEAARELARQHNVFDRLRPIFDFVPGAITPPPAPRHASKPKQPKKAPGPLQTGHGIKRKSTTQALSRLDSMVSCLLFSLTMCRRAAGRGVRHIFCCLPG